MSYAVTFSSRGGRYESAMRRFPNVRDGEFRAVVEFAGIGEGSVVIDVPAGGGYLRRYLPKTAEWIGIEVAESFLVGASDLDGALRSAKSLSAMPVPSGSVDRVVSVAGLHHEDDRPEFYREARRVLRDGGLLTIAEVAEDSKVARFLDGFVDAHGEGHRGNYWSDRDRSDLGEAGFVAIESVVRDVAWRARSVDELVAFVSELFALDRASPTEVAAALERDLGVVESDGHVRLSWEMVLTRGRRSDDARRR